LLSPLFSFQISRRADSNEFFHRELLNGFEDLKEEMILERRRAFEKLHSEEIEREKQRDRVKKQRERDLEISEEKRFWAMKQREERELVRKVLELERECSQGNLRGRMEREERVRQSISHRGKEEDVDEEEHEEHEEEEEGENLVQKRQPKFDLVSLQKSRPASRASENENRRAASSSRSVLSSKDKDKETPKAQRHHLER
jgi:hypothetical protein